jgi:hypothetical protein
MKLQILKWKQFQHYGQMRRPPWIKLHRHLLDNRHWHELSPSSSKLLVECWLLASEELDGALRGDVIDDLCWRLHRTQEETLPALKELAAAGFISIDYYGKSKALAPGERDARSGAPLEPRSIEKSREEIKRVRAVRRKYSEAFEEVWKIHARGPKAKADEEYLAAVANGVTHDELIVKLTGYVAAELRPDDNPPFKGQHLFRWLKEGRWEEDFEVKKDDSYRPASVFEWFPPDLKELGGGK